MSSVRWWLVAVLSLAFTSVADAQWAPGGVAFPITPYEQWALIPDGAGGVLSVFQPVPGTRDLRTQRVLADGTLDPLNGASGQFVARSAYGFGISRAIDDGAGGVLVSFVRCGPIAPHSPCWEYGTKWLLRSAHGAPVPSWPDTGIALVADGRGDPAPIVGDGAFGMIALLDSTVMRWSGAGAALWVPEPGRAGVRVTLSTMPKSGLQIAPDGAGGLIAAWTEQPVPGSPLRTVLMNGISPAGERTWDDFGIEFASGNNVALRGLSPDGAGGVYLAWTFPIASSPGTADSVLVQHVDATATPLWDPAGVPAGRLPSGAGVTLWPAGQDDVALVVTGMSGAWRAQKLSQGACAWPGAPSGVEVGVPGVLQVSLRVLPASAGALFVAWTEARLVRQAPWLTLLDASGGVAAGWTLEGTALDAGADDAWLDALLPGSTADECIVGWTRPATVYLGLVDQVVQKATTAGVLSVPPAPAALALAAPWPNPARDGWTVRFSLPAAGDATVELFDVAGRRVGGERLRAAAAGPRQVRLDAGGLAPGVYRLRLRAAAGERTRMVVLAR